jgi:hypothetical protein
MHHTALCIKKKKNQHALGVASANGDSPSIGFCNESLIAAKYDGASGGGVLAKVTF